MQTSLFGRSTVWAALLAVLPGCSFAFVDGPPTTHKQLPYFECSSSNVLPTVDAVTGGLFGVAAVGMLVDSSSNNQDGKSEALIDGAVAVVLAASAIYGYQKTTACREAKEQLMVRLGNGGGFAPHPAAPPVDPWLNPPPSSFTAPPPAAAPTAPNPPGPAQDNEVPSP